MAVLEFVRAFTPGALLEGSRSTVLNTLGWMAALLVSALIGASLAASPTWMQAMFAIAFSADFVLFLAAFVYFGITDKDALRSEKFGIQKMAIERGMIGDSSSGIFPVDSVDTIPAKTESQATQNLPVQIEQSK